MEWNERLISTDVDKLLKYLSQEGSASTGQAAKDLGISEDMIEVWANSLEQAGLITKSYSATKGTILEIKDVEEAERRVEEMKDGTKQQIEEAADDLDAESEEIQHAQETLQDLAEVFEKEIEYAKKIEEDLEELHEEEEELAKDAEESKGEKQEIEEKIVQTLSDVEEQLEELGGDGLDVEQFRERREQITEDVSELQTLSEKIRKVKQHQAEQDDETVCEVCGKSFDSKKGKKIHQSQVHTEDEVEAARQENGQTEDESTGLFGRLKGMFSP